MSTAFLYITPQGAGNKGIACIMLTVVDGQGNPVRNLECPRPVPDAYKDGLLPEDFENLTSTCLYENISSTSKSPGKC